jgi:pantoate--beta-alanine ligase
MFLFKKIAPLRHFLAIARKAKGSVGFVPTMGALHEGHAALVTAALQAHDCVVCSIFVNPTQFNDARDLEKYPRTPHKDIELLTKVGCHALFMPSVQEVYPSAAPPELLYQFRHLDQVMEGAFRPGHFAGVAQVVRRLLDIVGPDAIYMGQKDFQQVRIVQEMLAQTALPVRLVMCPTVRETDGLAMSSRNTRLTAAHRSEASVIHQALLRARELAASHAPVQEIQRTALAMLNASPGFQAEYFEIVDATTLLPLEHLGNGQTAVACTAVWAGEVRLIDNMLLG